MGTDMHGPHYGWSMHQALAMLLVPDKDYLNSGSSVYTIDTGKTRGTTFKIDTGGYVFPCLFDSGAEISCMNMETVHID